MSAVSGGKPSTVAPRSALFLVLLLVSAQSNWAGGPVTNSTAPATGTAPFALIDPVRAAGLSTRTATAHTRAVLLRGTAWAGKSARPIGWIDGESASIVALRDLPVLLDMAVAWRLGWDATNVSAAAQAGRFRDTALQWLEDWVKTCRVGFNPLNENRLDQLVIAWDLLSAAASPALRERMAGWLRQLSDGYLQDRGGQPPASLGNCWQSHRVKLAVLAAFASGDGARIAAAEAAFRRQLDTNIQSDGSPRDFVDHDSLAYAVYDLQPLVLAALAARAHGRDWYRMATLNGQSLEKALLWLSTFAAGRRYHQEFVYSTVAAEREKAAAKSGGFGQNWNPVNACTLYWMAVRLDERWLPLAARLGHDQSWLAVVLPTADPPVYAVPSVPPSASPKTAAGTSPSATAKANQAQLTALLQALQGGVSTAQSTTNSTTGLPSLLSLLDTLGGSTTTASDTGSAADSAYNQ